MPTRNQGNSYSWLVSLLNDVLFLGRSPPPASFLGGHHLDLFPLITSHIPSLIPMS